MARSEFGGSIWDVVANEDATNVGTDATPGRKALALVRNTAIPLFLASGTAATDLMVWSGGAFVATTSISTDANGYLPRFQGPDGVTVLYTTNTGSGPALRAVGGSGGGTGTVTAIGAKTPNSSGVVTLTQDDIGDGVTAKQFTATDEAKLAGIEAEANVYTDTEARAAIGIPAGHTIPTHQGDNVWEGENTFPPSTIPASSISDLEASFDAYVTTKGIPKFKAFANGTTPPVEPNTVWGELGVGVVANPSAVLVTHNVSNADQATYNFPPDNTMVAASLYVAFVWGGTSLAGGQAPIAGSITGRGVTWTKIGAGVRQASGATSLQAFLGIGTPAASGDMSVTFPTTSDGCHLEIVAVSNVSTTIPANGFAYAGPATALTAPAVSLAAAPATTAFQLFALGINSISNTITADPGTPLGTTPDMTSSPPAMASRVSSKTAAIQNPVWTKSANAQYTAMTIVFTPAA